MLDLHDILRVELHVLAVEGQFHPAAHAQPHARRDLAAQLDRLALRYHIAADHQRAFIVRDLKQHRPHSGAARLVAVELEHLPLDHDLPRLGRQLAEGQHTPSGDLAAQNDAAAAADLAARGFRHVGEALRRGADAQRHARELIAACKLLLDPFARAVAQLSAHGHVKRHGALLRLKHHVGHRRGVERHAQVKFRRKVGEQFKKGYLLCHKPRPYLSQSFSISSIKASTSRSCGTL